MWVCDDAAAEVFVYDTAGAWLGRWSLDPENADASGLTNDPGGGTSLWVVNKGTDAVYHYSDATTVRSGALSATTTFALADADDRPEGIADPPQLTVEEPAEETRVLAGDRILVSGQARPGDPPAPVTHVTVNGVPVDAADSAGNFFTQRAVAPGQNVLQVVATDALGETSERTVIVNGVQAAAGQIDFDALADNSASVVGEYGRTSFREASDVMCTEVAARNAGQYVVGVPLLLGVQNISNPTVRIGGFDGKTPEGIPYFDLTDDVGDGILEPGELTGWMNLEFYNPQHVQFTYELVFLGPLNESPRITSVPAIEALVGKPYNYDVDATDSDADTLSFSLLSGPQGVDVDPATGQITWSATGNDLGTHMLAVQVEDGRGGVDRQDYVLSVREDVPNRPPVFVSVPGVTANINVPYRYQAATTDRDGDTTSYALVSGPPGNDCGSRHGAGRVDPEQRPDRPAACPACHR